MDNEDMAMARAARVLLAAGLISEHVALGLISDYGNGED